MFAAVRDALRRRPLSGLAASLGLHVLVLALIFAGGLPAAQYSVKRGEPIMIDLPELPESPPPGPRPVPSSAPAVKRPAPQPPAQSTAPSPRPLESVKSAVAAKPMPPAPEPPLVARRPAPPGPSLAPPEPVQEPADAATASPPPALNAPAPPTPRVAAIPPERDDPVDIRAALRRGAAGGAGGRGEGRGGIEGEPIPLDSADPKYSDYLDHIRRKIKSNWGYPCVRDDATGACDYKTASLVVEFGIARDGQVRFVNVVRASGWTLYDDYAVNAIKLSSPFLPVPDALSKGAGIPILATFSYVVTTSVTNLLH